jgi:hypothetical protein
LDVGPREVPPSIYLPLLSVSLYLKHKLTKAALGDHLRVLRLNQNSHITRLSSVHNLLSKYASLKTELTKTYICSKKKCCGILELDENKKNPLPNQPCGHRRKPVFSTGRECYIVRLPIAMQIEHFIQHQGLPTEWSADPDYRGDINTGGCYNDKYSIQIQHLVQ